MKASALTTITPQKVEEAIISRFLLKISTYGEGEPLDYCLYTSPSAGIDAVGTDLQLYVGTNRGAEWGGELDPCPEKKLSEITQVSFHPRLSKKHFELEPPPTSPHNTPVRSEGETLEICM